MSGMQQPAAPAMAPSNTNSILAALANMARQNTAAPQAQVPQGIAPQNSSQIPNGQSNVAQQMGSLNPTFPFTTSAQPVNMPAPAATYALQGQGQSNGAQNFPSNPAITFGAPAPPTQAPVNPALQQQILLLKTLADQGIPQEQWGTIIAALNAAQGNAAAGMPQQPPQFPLANQNQNGWQGSRPEESRDRNGFNEPVRSPPGRYRRRSRSPSPARAWGARDSPNSHRRDDGSYDEYHGNSPGHAARNRGEDRGGRGRGGNDYRQRSPQPRRGRSPSPPGRYDQGPPREKWIEYDPAIGKGSIKGKFDHFVHASC